MDKVPGRVPPPKWDDDGAPAPAPTGYNAVLSALSSGVHIEAAFTVRDVQRARARIERWRSRMSRLTVGRAHFDAAVQEQTGWIRSRRRPCTRERPPAPPVSR